MHHGCGYLACPFKGLSSGHTEGAAGVHHSLETGQKASLTHTCLLDPLKIYRWAQGTSLSQLLPLSYPALTIPWELLRPG